MIKLDSLAPVLFLVMWSSGAVIVKLGLQYSSEWNFLAIRATLSLLCVSALVWITKRFFKQAFTFPDRMQLSTILVVGLMLQVLYLTFYILAIASGMSPGLVTLVLGLQPLITPLISKQPISAARFALLGLGFTGLFIAIFGAQSVEKIEWQGILFSLLALLSLTGGTVKQADVRLPSIQAMWYQCLLSSVVFVVVSIHLDGYVDWQPELIFSVGWMSIVVSVGALLLLMFMVQRESSDKVSVLFYAIPMVTYLFDHLLFGAQLSTITLIGMVMVAICVMLYRRKPKTRCVNENSSVLPQNNR